MGKPKTTVSQKLKHELCQKNNIYFVSGDQIILIKSKTNMDKNNTLSEILTDNFMWIIKMSLHSIIMIEIFVMPVKKMD